MLLMKYSDRNFARSFAKFSTRPKYPPEIETAVAEIMLDVRENGDKALVKYAKKFDGAALTPKTFLVRRDEIDEAGKSLSSREKKAIRTALGNIRDFSAARRPKSWSRGPRRGVTLGEKFSPMDRVGVYVPGGSAPLVSTVIHTAGVASAAGVREIVAATPPGPDGRVTPAVLYAMREAGVCEIYRLGGVYGVAAMAYGTETIRRVEKIAGPGNAYVTAAKKIAYGDVSIDLVAGPSEIMVIADDSGVPEFIAADMLSQAEHGSGLEQAVLACSSQSVIKAVLVELDRQARRLSRAKTVEKVLKSNVAIVEVGDMSQAAEVANLYAPEHLEIMCARPSSVAARIHSAGAIFLGKWTPEPVGDFTAGPSHVLPTAGTAKFFSGLTVESFFRRSSVVSYDKRALEAELDAIVSFSEMERLDAHGECAKIRFARKD